MDPLVFLCFCARDESKSYTFYHENIGFLRFLDPLSMLSNHICAIFISLHRDHLYVSSCVLFSTTAQVSCASSRLCRTDQYRVRCCMRTWLVYPGSQLQACVSCQEQLAVASYARADQYIAKGQPHIILRTRLSGFRAL